MATSRVCSIPDCGKPSFGRGWCKAHHMRFLRHGDPLAGRTAVGSREKFLYEAVAANSDDCIPWPFSKTNDGYGQFIFQGKSTKASRAACRLAHGEPPTSRHQAAHACGKADCVNPKHLRWATPQENEADKAGHGTNLTGEKVKAAKLTNEGVRVIRAAYAAGHSSQYELAAMFGVSQHLISRIVRNLTWRNVA